MNKIFFSVILLFLCSYCFSQQKGNKMPVLETNIFNLFMCGPSIALDIPVSKNISIRPSVQSGKFNWGNFGGLHKYKSFEAEIKKHSRDTYFGGYIKHVTKEVNSKENDIVFIPVSYDRNFKGNAIAFGAVAGFEIPVVKRFYIDFNFQLGGGIFYKMTDKLSYNLPNDNFLDYRIACWIGYRL